MEEMNDKILKSNRKERGLTEWLEGRKWKEADKTCTEEKICKLNGEERSCTVTV